MTTKCPIQYHSTFMNIQPISRVQRFIGPVGNPGSRDIMKQQCITIGKLKPGNKSKVFKTDRQTWCFLIPFPISTSGIVSSRYHCVRPCREQCVVGDGLYQSTSTNKIHTISPRLVLSRSGKYMSNE